MKLHERILNTIENNVESDKLGPKIIRGTIMFVLCTLGFILGCIIYWSLKWLLIYINQVIG